MIEIQWRDKLLNVAVREAEGTAWLALDEIVAVLEGHLQPLPGDGLGLCSADDICLPLGPDDLRLENGVQLVRLASLSPLGLGATGSLSQGQILLGDPLPELTFTRLEGGSFALRELPQKPTLLFAWASW